MLNSGSEPVKILALRKLLGGVIIIILPRPKPLGGTYQASSTLLSEQELWGKFYTRN